jgi:hypothetical protein
MADFDSQLPIRSLAANNCTEIADSGGTTIDPVEEFAQSSATAGQKGALIQGAVTTAAPSYTTGNTDPLSLTTSGLLRVDGSGSTQPVSGTVTANAGTGTFDTNLAQVAGTATAVNTGNSNAGTQRVVLASDQPAVAVTFSAGNTELVDYSTGTGIAANASSTQTYTPAAAVRVNKITAAASGQMKIEVQWGVTGSETTQFVTFTSKGNLISDIAIPNGVNLTTTDSVKVIRTNLDNQAMNVYSSVFFQNV